MKRVIVFIGILSFVLLLILACSGKVEWLSKVFFIICILALILTAWYLARLLTDKDY